MGTASPQHRLSCHLQVERWRLRDAAACVRASSMFDVALDAAVGTKVAFGAVPLALGHASGGCWHHRQNGADSEDVVARYRRRERIRITYGPVVPTVGAELSIETDRDDRTLTSTVETAAGSVATVEQLLAETPLVEQVDGHADDAQAQGPGTEQLTRVRVARWVYISGECPTVHGNHVAASLAGLPGAVVPESLLAALAERLLFADGNAPSGELALDFTEPVFAGESVRVEAEANGEGGAAALRFITGRGVAARAGLG